MTGSGFAGPAGAAGPPAPGAGAEPGVAGPPGPGGDVRTVLLFGADDATTVLVLAGSTADAGSTAGTGAVHVAP